MLTVFGRKLESLRYKEGSPKITTTNKEDRDRGFAPTDIRGYNLGREALPHHT